MLPDLRAVLAAIVAVVALMMGAFGLAATLRVARDNQSSPLQAARSTLLTDAALHGAFPMPASLARDEPAPGTDTPPADTASMALPAAEDAAPPQPEPAQTASLPVAATPGSPETTGSIEAASVSVAPVTLAATVAPVDAAHVDAAVPAALAPSAEPPVGGPLQEAALTPSQAPDLKPIVVTKKPRAAARVKRPSGSRQARARDAAKRIAAAQARRAKAAATTPSQPAPATNTWGATNFNQ